MGEIKLPKKEAPGDLPETEKDWVTYVNNVIDSSRMSKRVYERQWTTNLAFVLGFQDLIYNQMTGVIDLSKDYTIPITINRIGAFVESRQAKLIKTRPIGKVIPNTGDILDERGAKYSDQLLVHLWRALSMEEELDRVLTVMLSCAPAFMKQMWDPNCGDYIYETKNEDGVVELSDEGLEREKIFMGDVSSKFKSPFSIFVPNNNIPHIKDQAWVGEEDFFTIAEIEHMYPHLTGLLSPEDDSGKSEFQRLVDRMTSTLLATHDRKQIKEDSINSQNSVKTLWIKPTPQYPKGIVVVVTGEHLCAISKFPYDYGKNVYPLVKFAEKNNGFHFWSPVTVEQLIPIQKAINMVKRLKVTSTKLMGNPKWLVAKGSQLSEEAIDDTTAEVIEYNPAVPEPKPVQMSGLPAYISQLGLELIDDMRDVANQREASVAPPPQLTAAVALQTFTELSEEPLIPIVRRLARSLEYVQEQHLIIANEEYIEKRKIKILGDEGEVAVQYLRNLDLRNNTDVHIEIESMIPELRGQKLQRTFDLWDRRIIQDPGEFIELMRYGNFDKLIARKEKQKEQVALDIIQMKKGNQPEIHAAQNHLLYIQLLSDFVQTPEFLQLIPERKKLILNNLQAHTQAIAPTPEQPQQNQAAVGSQFGPITPAGSPGGGQ